MKPRSLVVKIGKDQQWRWYFIFDSTEYEWLRLTFLTISFNATIYYNGLTTNLPLSVINGWENFFSRLVLNEIVASFAG